MENRIKKIFTSRIFLFLSGFIIVSLIISAVLNTLTPDPPPAITVIQSDQRFDAQITVEDSPLSIPAQLQVYVAANSSLNLDDYAQELSGKMGLERHPVVKNSWVNFDKTTILTLENDNKIISYQQSLSASEISTVVLEGDISIDFLKQKVVTFIQDHQLFENYEISGPIFYKITSEFFNPVDDILQADAFAFIVNQKIDGIPVISGSNTTSPATITVDSRGKVLKAFFYPTFKSVEQVENYKSLSKDQIFANAKNNALIYLDTASIDFAEPKAKSLTKISFTTATLEYRLNEKNHYILPYVRFSGTGEDKDGKKFVVEAITPAIEVGN